MCGKWPLKVKGVGGGVGMWILLIAPKKNKKSMKQEDESIFVEVFKNNLMQG